ncbi:hypothetical protein SSP35_18_00310 [Streptomyces sp. NBRC 110611]|uniref:DUF4255 domain-containing protein n=1 Tax=Streptomyces sp. NBRC 110611 TaxID=1621259 RepID=UPI00082B3D0C|nr:DUF4255 domain-containing protein [Streptomyces sp. NBRC 110611]GAU70303.1 hypothetical protein SSP35_18_00310 [Streptomyces sp. NBRC 110611]
MSVVHRVDETLKEGLLRGPLRAANAQVLFETPDSDWAARRSGPCVNVFLYGIEEDSSRTQSGGVSVVDEQGAVVGYGTPPRFFRLLYLVSVWAQSVQDEHRMLGTLLEWCVRTEELTVTGVPGRGDPGARLSLGLRETPPGAESAASRLWTSLGTPARPVLDLVVTVPLGRPTQDTGPAPAKGLALRALQLPDTAQRSGDPATTPPMSEPAQPVRRRSIQEMA